MTGIWAAAAIAVLAMILGVAPTQAQNAYITNSGNGTVSVIATPSNTVTGNPITVGTTPYGVAVTPDGSKVYVANNGSNNVSAIATASNTVIATNAVGGGPFSVAVTPDGSKVYVANNGSNNVSVIATASNTVIATIAVGSNPFGVAVTPDGSKVYVTNVVSNNVSVIATASNTVIATVAVGSSPSAVAVTPDGSEVYVANRLSNSVSVIATASNTVISTITVGSNPVGVAVTPDGSKVYVANEGSNNVSVIATASNTVIGGPITVGIEPFGVAVTPDGSKIYVANFNTNSVSVIATATNTVVATIPVGTEPIALGNFIGPTSTSTLTVAENGTGSGQVVSNPSGITCSANSIQCAAPFAAGAQVTLTASAAAGSTFAGWSGGGCGGTGSCVVTLSANTTVTASFGTAPTSPLVAAVVPSSQSVEVGSTATATATIINGGSATASQCAIAPIGALAATFSYQALPGGTVNTPVNIPAGGTVSFTISLTPTAVIAPGVNVQFSFACANIPQQATVLIGINTLFFSAATTPVANIVTTATVPNNSNGILVLDPNTGSGSFAVSTTNQSIGANITVSANTGAATLPVTITLCQTDPASGQCLASPGPSVTLTINAGAQMVYRGGCGSAWMMSVHPLL